MKLLITLFKSAWFAGAIIAIVMGGRMSNIHPYFGLLLILVGMNMLGCLFNNY